MLFLDSHIIEPSRHFLGKQVHAASGCHGRSNANYTAVHMRQFKQDLPEHILITACTLVALYSLTCLRIKHSGRMPDRLVRLCGRISFSFFCQRMKKYGAVKGFQFPQSGYDLAYVIAVNRPEVTESHCLEKVASASSDEGRLGIDYKPLEPAAEFPVSQSVPDPLLRLVVARV